MADKALNSIRIEVDQEPSNDKDELVRNALHEFNVDQIGQDQHFSVFAYDSNNEIIAGVLIYAETRSLFIDILWVKESMRGTGIGSQLLVAAENEGVRRNIPYATTDTFAFQAVEFYLKNGYEEIGVINDYIEGHDRIFFRKKLIK